jgi:antitoxin (DNA-binding transcriptional repressor) of toxin-antitoxin stability system
MATYTIGYTMIARRLAEVKQWVEEGNNVYVVEDGKVVAHIIHPDLVQLKETLVKNKIQEKAKLKVEQKTETSGSDIITRPGDKFPFAEYRIRFPKEAHLSDATIRQRYGYMLTD